MIIQVTDAGDVYVPRFCYHDKLSIAANCRMCLVEVEKAPKPLPACATPVTEGMKVFTRSPKAIAAPHDGQAKARGEGVGEALRASVEVGMRIRVLKMPER